MLKCQPHVNVLMTWIRKVGRTLRMTFWTNLVSSTTSNAASNTMWPNSSLAIFTTNDFIDFTIALRSCPRNKDKHQNTQTYTTPFQHYNQCNDMLTNSLIFFFTFTGTLYFTHQEVLWSAEFVGRFVCYTRFDSWKGQVRFSWNLAQTFIIGHCTSATKMARWCSG